MPNIISDDGWPEKYCGSPGGQSGEEGLWELRVSAEEIRERAEKALDRYAEEIQYGGCFCS